MPDFGRRWQLVPVSRIDSPPQPGNHRCPAAAGFAAVCARYNQKLADDAPLVTFNITHLLLLHEFWQHYAETTPEHHPCLVAVFATWYKTIRTRELARITAMSFQPSSAQTAKPDYPDLVGFEEDEIDEKQ